MRLPKIRLHNLIAITTVVIMCKLNVAASEMGIVATAVRKQVEVVESVLEHLIIKKENQAVSYRSWRTVSHGVKLHRTCAFSRKKDSGASSSPETSPVIGHSTYLSPKLIALIKQMQLCGLKHFAHSAG